MKNKKCPLCKKEMCYEKDNNHSGEEIYRYHCYSCHFGIEIADLGFVSEEKKALFNAFVEKTLDDYEKG